METSLTFSPHFTFTRVQSLVSRFFVEGGRRDGSGDRRVATELLADCQALVDTVLFNRRPAQHRSDVSVLANVVHQSVHHFNSGQVSNIKDENIGPAFLKIVQQRDIITVCIDVYTSRFVCGG